MRDYDVSGLGASVEMGNQVSGARPFIFHHLSSKRKPFFSLNSQSHKKVATTQSNYKDHEGHPTTTSKHKDLQLPGPFQEQEPLGGKSSIFSSKHLKTLLGVHKLHNPHGPATSSGGGQTSKANSTVHNIMPTPGFSGASKSSEVTNSQKAMDPKYRPDDKQQMKVIPSFELFAKQKKNKSSEQSDIHLIDQKIYEVWGSGDHQSISWNVIINCKIKSSVWDLCYAHSSFIVRAS